MSNNRRSWNDKRREWLKGGSATCKQITGIEKTTYEDRLYAITSAYLEALSKGEHYVSRIVKFATEKGVPAQIAASFWKENEDIIKEGLSSDKDRVKKLEKWLCSSGDNKGKKLKELLETEFAETYVRASKEISAWDKLDKMLSQRDTLSKKKTR